MSMLRTRFVLVALLGSLIAPVALGQAQPSDPYIAVLAEQAILPQSDSIVAYLRTLPPSDENRRQIRLCIAQLSAADYAKRELAARQLVAMPIVPIEELRDASQSDDAEIRYRAQNIMAARSMGNASSSVAVACFRTISRLKLRGAAAPLLDVLPLYGEDYVLSAGRDALCATVSDDDAALLRKAMKSGPVESRVAAFAALTALLREQAAGEVHPFMNDEEPRIRLAAARSLAQHGDRACLATLVNLLGCADQKVRHGASSTLRALTRRTSDYAAWIEPAAQQASIAEWKRWLVSDAGSARLHYPPSQSDFELGRTLICLYAKNEVVEIDAMGRQTLLVSEPSSCPWACQGLPNGNRLVALYSTNTLVEYGPDGKEILRIPVPGGPMSVQRLDNGRTLLACNNAQKVVEVDRRGNIAWEVSLCGGPCDAVRLDNGHTLITLQNANAVVEVDRDGRELWRIDSLNTPRSASRLENGNTLVCDLGSGKVIEFDRAAQEVWSQGGFSSPFCAQRLASGATLVSDTQAIKEIDPSGRTLSENKMGSLGRVFKY